MFININSDIGVLPACNIAVDDESFYHCTKGVVWGDGVELDWVPRWTPLIFIYQQN